MGWVGGGWLVGWLAGWLGWLVAGWLAGSERLVSIYVFMHVYSYDIAVYVEGEREIYLLIMAYTRFVE